MDRNELLVPRTGLEPVSLTAADFKSAVYTSSTTRAGGGLSHRWMLAHSVRFEAVRASSGSTAL